MFPKMLRFWEIFCWFSLLLVKVHVYGDYSKDNPASIDSVMLSLIETFEHPIVPNEEDPHRSNLLENVDRYDTMSTNADIIIKLIDDHPTYAYKFLEYGGLENIIYTHLTDFHLELRTKLLILTKKLFEMAPTTTNALMPITAVDKIVDIFEGDSDEEIKARALDILYIWLPNNPKVQARVMKTKGLEPFYEQALKLDSTAIIMILDLFNKILEEHTQARNYKKYRNAAEVNKLNIYKKIGLIERLSTPVMCNGLLNIFEASWNFRFQNDDIILSIFKILKNVINPCYGILKGNAKAVQLFKNFLEALGEKGKESYFSEKGFNATEFHAMLETYIEKLKTSRNDEL